MGLNDEFLSLRKLKGREFFFSETVVSKDVFSSDDALGLPVARIYHHHVAAVIDAELVKHLVELVVDGDGDRALDHVRTQINPLLVALLNHVQDHRLSISFTGENVDLEIPPGQELVLWSGRETVLLVVIESELVDGAAGRHVLRTQVDIVLTDL